MRMNRYDLANGIRIEKATTPSKILKNIANIQQQIHLPISVVKKGEVDMGTSFGKILARGWNCKLPQSEANGRRQSRTIDKA